MVADIDATLRSVCQLQTGKEQLTLPSDFVKSLSYKNHAKPKDDVKLLAVGKRYCVSFLRDVPFYFKVYTTDFDFPGELEISNNQAVCITYLSYSKGKPSETHFDSKTRDKILPLRRIDYFKELQDPVLLQTDPEKPPTKEQLLEFEKQKAEQRTQRRLRKRADHKTEPKLSMG